ncbi:hypothetical protein CerSpe_284350 [Prunus speciosa]
MNKSMESNGEAPINDLFKCLSCKWATGVGPRIGWVREYPSELRFRALEQVRLSAQPQPKPTIRVSPRLSPKATSVEWAFLLTGLCLEILSLAFDQASSPSKPQYALLGMILAIASGSSFTRRWGRLWWFYYPHSQHWLFGTLPDFYGLVGGISQCICSTVQHVCFRRHADNPIKVSLWPAIFLICLGAKR